MTLGNAGFGAAPDEVPICPVFSFVLTECTFRDFHKVHNHLRKSGLMHLHAMKRVAMELTAFIAYVLMVLDIWICCEDY